MYDSGKDNKVDKAILKKDSSRLILRDDPTELFHKGVSPDGHDIYLDSFGEQYVFSDKMQKVINGDYENLEPLTSGHTVVERFTKGDPIANMYLDSLKRVQQRSELLAPNPGMEIVDDRDTPSRKISGN